MKKKTTLQTLLFEIQDFHVSKKKCIKYSIVTRVLRQSINTTKRMSCLADHFKRDLPKLPAAVDISFSSLSKHGWNVHCKRKLRKIEILVKTYFTNLKTLNNDKQKAKIRS